MRPILTRLLLCLSLLGFGSAAAAESRHMGPDGGGAQSDASSGSERIDESEETGSTGATRRTADAKTRQGTATRGATRSNAPRWHSFLPGMIR